MRGIRVWDSFTGPPKRLGFGYSFGDLGFRVHSSALHIKNAQVLSFKERSKAEKVKASKIH